MISVWTTMLSMLSHPKQPVYNPRTIQPLLSDEDIRVRLTVLAALKTYAEVLVALTNNTDSPQLDSASKSAGKALTGLGNSVAPTIESSLGIAVASGAVTTTTVATTTSGNTSQTTSSTSSTPVPVISTDVQNGISTGIDALGQFLVSRKIKRELPQKVIAMDPPIDGICHLFEEDIDILQAQEKLDYDWIINQQTAVFAHNA